ncbi:bifunctional folylpolyglutamate synthase/dihydrofolate synthase [Kaistella palustris]|uniref:bifunctional folylpolyglutamate synthase/dihydrofolate synthase n=1 Tax=Kaistella palustris TaxID=493376 RepID=UPI0004269F79|nr:folylpolyglutamate synthase/dihydrofolate synthase family protein [Kaistella palustris]
MTDQEYQQEIDWLFVQIPSFQNEGETAYKPGLENIKKLCTFFGNPEQNLKMVHIGGTNGKGSTSSMLASVLQEAGYRTGLYTSPHLIDFRERIKINGKKCDREFVYQFIRKLQNLPSHIVPSFFEFTTVMAFEYFRLQKVDIAIIEVGLGGRLDSTNIIQPLVTAITNVALDHQNILGNSIQEITAEKAGIIKPGIPVICGDEDPTTREIIRKKAQDTGAEFVDATLIRTDLRSDLQGNYQSKNIKVVLALIAELRKIGYAITESEVENGLLHVQGHTDFLGRWYQFSDEPLVICDTAHNHAGLEKVFAQLNSIPKFKHIVLGFVNDKRIDEVLMILPLNSSFYFAKPGNNRGRHPAEYEDLLQKAEISYKIFNDVDAAYLSAKQHVQKDEMIFIGGSNFVVGEFLEKNLEK